MNFFFGNLRKSKFLKFVELKIFFKSNFNKKKLKLVTSLTHHPQMENYQKF